MAQRAANDANILAFIKTKQPLDGGRIGQPGHLDSAAICFLSDPSKFTTGQVLAVDGGLTVGGCLLVNSIKAEVAARLTNLPYHFISHECCQTPISVSGTGRKQIQFLCVFATLRLCVKKFQLRDKRVVGTNQHEQ